MKKLSRITAVILSAILIFTLTTTVYAANDTYQFSDVKDNHWAIDEIIWMIQNEIIEGVGGNRFEPNRVVTRAEFAKMMVLTLRIQLSSPGTPFFLDVKRNDWEYQYVESARFYLTGFRTSAGDYYKPDDAAVREDMAVALVKALGFDKETADLSTLNKFADRGQISENLRSHVALAVKHGLMEGYNEKGGTYFKPKSSLTRAEAAVLLYRAFKNHEDKITYDDNKVTYDDDYTTPVVSVSAENNKLVVSWNKINSNKLKAYAVVVSKNDSSPRYADNGYLYYITDKNQTRTVIDNSTEYSGTSDFGKYLKKGESYYFSVTAVYNDRYVEGNTVRKTYNGPEDPTRYEAPKVSISIENDTHVVRWNKIDTPDFKAYAIVISKDDATPVYPGNGYLIHITDKNKCYAVINNNTKYNKGDFGNYLTNGQRYYVSVTAVYRDRNVAGNAVRFRYDGPDNPEAYISPKVTASVENNRHVLRWDRIDSSNLLGYRVVASKDDSSPEYPDNGHLFWITDKNRNYAVIDNSTAYTSGDFGKYFTNGQRYYLGVTAVYRDRNVTGNAVRIMYSGTENPDLYQTPVVTSVIENGRLVLRWNKIDSPKLQGYRVVASKDDSSPEYPDNGYLYWITDKNKDYAVIDNTTPYNRGDFGKYFVSGETYHFSVTAVYDDRNVKGNTIKRKYDGPDNPELFPVPVVRAEYEDGRLAIKWDKIVSPELLEYRVVISKNNQSPIYPANGYYGIYDKDVTSVILDDLAEYKNGDFRKLTDSTEYYFSVTAVYSNSKCIAGNAVKKLYLLPPR